MIEWLITSVLLNLPSGFWVFGIILGLTMMVTQNFFNSLPIPYTTWIRPAGMLIIFGSVFMYGGTEINDIWQQRQIKAEEKILSLEKDSKIKNVEIVEIITYKDRIIETKGKDIIKEIEKIVTIAGPEKTIEIPGPERIIEITKDMTVEQKKVYEEQIENLRRLNKQQQDRVIEIIKDLTPEQKKAYEEQIDQLKRVLSNQCAIPKLLLDEYNEATRNPNKIGDKK